MSMHVVRRDCDTCGEGVLPLTLVEGEDEIYGMTMEDAASIHASLSALLGKPPLGAPAPSSSRTVKVRIAVAVHPGGEWCATGSSDEPEPEFNECGDMHEVEAGWSLRFVEADVPLPAVETVQGRVTGEQVSS